MAKYSIFSQPRPFPRPLLQDLHLHTESISLVNGHAGAETVFTVADRAVWHRTWVMTKRKFRFPWQSRYKEVKQEYALPIPPEITTEDALYKYVREHAHGWLGRKRFDDSESEWEEGLPEED